MEELETSPALDMDELLAAEDAPAPVPIEDAQLKAVLEAIVYVAEEPLTAAQMAGALQEPLERIEALLGQLVAEFDKPEHGVSIREVAGGFKMTTKAEHHEAVRSFVKSLKPPLKLSLPALETLAVIAYKQPVTAPEVMAIRGVQGASVLKTLLDRKLIASAGRKNVIGKPILYQTTREFLIQFGLKDLSELPSLKEFEEIRRMAFADAEQPELPGLEEAAERPPDPPGAAHAPDLPDAAPPAPGPRPPAPGPRPPAPDPRPLAPSRPAARRPDAGRAHPEDPLAGRRGLSPTGGTDDGGRPRHGKRRGGDRTRLQSRS
jgi:segregation and condensation protein B